MDQANTTDAYRRILDPNDSPRIQRHRHERFRFQSVAAFEPPPSVEDWLNGSS